MLGLGAPSYSLPPSPSIDLSGPGPGPGQVPKPSQEKHAPNTANSSGGGLQQPDPNTPLLVLSQTAVPTGKLMHVTSGGSDSESISS